MEKVCLNLGCWHREIPGWVHVDLCDLPHIDFKSNINDLHMFEDKSVDLIYSSHSFEYFDIKEAPDVLNEWHRVLKPGGMLRLAVPDFDSLINLYKLTGDINSILGPLFGRMQIETKSSKKTLFHKTVYTFISLKNLLESNGFQGVERYDWKQTIHKDYDDHSQAYYPHMDKEKGLLLSLNIEAIKK